MHHDESYYLSPTPYGDTIDTILNDALPSVLAAYQTLVVAHRMTAEPKETARKLHEYVIGGGHLIITASAVLDLGGTFAGIQVGACTPVAAGTNFEVKVGDGVGDTVVEPMPLQLCMVTTPENATVLATMSSQGALLEEVRAPSAAAARQTAALRLSMSRGGGSVTLLAHGNYAMSTAPRTTDVFKCGIDEDPHADRQPCVKSCLRVYNVLPV